MVEDCKPAQHPPGQSLDTKVYCSSARQSAVKLDEEKVAEATAELCSDEALLSEEHRNEVSNPLYSSQPDDDGEQDNKEETATVAVNTTDCCRDEKDSEDVEVPDDGVEAAQVIEEGMESELEEGSSVEELPTPPPPTSSSQSSEEEAAEATDDCGDCDDCDVPGVDDTASPSSL